jgi:excisionase family DNA binding protein
MAYLKGQRSSESVQRPRKRLYTIDEAAVYLGRSPWAVRQLIWSGKIRYVRDGRRILLDIVDMDKWIEDSKTQFTF